ncbi:MAG: hypothetical protein KGJ47_10945 [Acidobacteriota bacterium]|nr:hypothetical protein [Acidobacteriota bacterium]
MVHLTLIVGFAASLATAITLSKKFLGHSGTTNHAIVSVVVLVVILAHLYQRRHTVARLSSQLLRRRGRAKNSRLAISDTILWLIVANTMVSGVADYVVGHTIFLPIPGPVVFQKWHGFSAIVLLVYVTVHVLRRRRRLRTSHIT